MIVTKTRLGSVQVLDKAKSVIVRHGIMTKHCSIFFLILSILKYNEFCIPKSFNKNI